MLEVGEKTEAREMAESLDAAIKDRIAEFNKTRGRRKELNPIFTAEVPDFRTTRCVKIGASGLYLGRISDLARATVLTLLDLKPRPEKVNFDVLTRDGELRYRLLVFKPRRSRKELRA